ncbi:hypothetical protein ACHAXR_010604 [Thalassiosira sp. AJA248-18]
MRMGRPTKKRKSSSRNKNNNNETQNPNPPKFSSPTLIVGQISSNLIQSVYTPALIDLAVQSVEEYADDMLVYEQEKIEAALMNGSGGGGSDDDDVELKEGEKEEEEEVELDLDGNIVPRPKDTPTHNNNNIPPPPTTNKLFTTQESIDELTSLLSETSSHFSTPSNSWKVHANAAKFERLLDEKYGKFRPFIESHPNVEIFIKNAQRKYAMGAFSPFRKGNSPVNKTTAIMVLFMMHRNNVRFEALVLTATFCLVGLQPWALVTLVALGKWEMDRRKGRRVRGMPRRLQVVESYYNVVDGKKEVVVEEELSEEEERAKKYDFLSRPVGSNFNPADLSIRDEEYDVLLLGSGPETLYTGALLARAGRKVCVLSPSEDVAECMVFEKQSKEGSKFANVPFDIRGMNISHLSAQSKLLAPALCTATDTQGGIRFARIGSSTDGYAHSILSVPGLGTDSLDSSIPIVMNATGGPAALAEYCSTCLGDGFPGTDLEGNDNGNSTSLGYLKACRQINAGSGEYYVSKLFAANAASRTDSFKSSESNVYQQATIRPASVFLNKCLPLNTHVRSLMAALGSANENSGPDNTSMAAHVTHLCAMMNEEGMAYPVGGPRALCHALTSVIEQCGGRVVRGVPLQELLFEKLPEKKKESDAKKKTKTKEGEEGASGPKPRCRGVRLQNGCEITVSDGPDGDGGAVISTLGLIATFLHLLPSDVRTAHGVPLGLPAISERRPLVKILVGLRGTKEELSLTGADWYRLPNATLPRDELDPLTGQVKFGTIGVDEAVGNSDDGVEKIDESGEGGNMEIAATASGGRGKRSKASSATAASSSSSSSSTLPRSKFTAGSSWMKVSFPSAKDPSWSDRHGSVSTCVVTIEADDDFVRMFDTKPLIYSIMNKDKSADMERLRDRVLKDVMVTFPQIEGNIECVHVVGPLRSGLTQNPARFAIKGNRPETNYPGLFIGGSDLTVSDSFSGGIVGGWLAANAAMGYSFLDHLYLKKNITSDLEQFLEEPSMATERDGVIVEDLAVPFKEKKIVVQKGHSDDDDGATNPAESSKEE